VTKRERDTERRKRIRQELHRDRREREQGYRARALKLLPHVCASCGREFSGKRLQELTVHHRDHNFKNNPPDGSNWELLCVYCHDHEHETHEHDAGGGGPVTIGDTAPPVANPFSQLDKLIEGNHTGDANGKG
jgi:5-methylcytosine-specific restriction endonuclease McrA